MAENKSEQNIVEPTSTQDKIEQNTVENVSEKPKLTEAQQKAADELMALSDAELYKWTEDWAIPGKETFPDEKSYVDAVRAVIEGMISNADWDVDYNFRAFSFTWVNKGVPAVREAAKRTIGLISDTGEVKPKLTEAQQKAADELMALSDEKLYQWAEDWAIPEKEAFPDKKSYVNSVRAVIIEMISNADWDKDLYFGNFSFTWVNNWVNKGIPAVREAAKKTIGLIP